MRSARVLITFAAVAFVATQASLVWGAVAAPSVSDRRTETRVEALKNGSKLWVKNRNGAIRVVGWDREEVSLSADIKDTERRRIQLVVQRKGADLDIEAVFQQPGFSFSFGFVQSPRCEMTLSVPRKLAAYFRTTNGTVEASAMEGYVRCETTNGDIRVKDIAGEVQAQTTNGGIEAQRLNARMKGETTNGRIQLEEVLGGVNACTTNGGIHAKNLEGWGEGITLETTNGGIDVELGKATGRIEASTTNGGVELKANGMQDVEVTKRSGHATIPGRTQKIRLSTTNGGIHVRP